MSLNISSDTLSIVTSVVLTFDANKLTKRQRTSYERMVKSGIVTGEGPPAKMAIAVLEQVKAPMIRMHRYGRLDWHNLSPDEVKMNAELVERACTMEKVEYVPDPEHSSSTLASVQNRMDRQHSALRDAAKYTNSYEGDVSYYRYMDKQLFRRVWGNVKLNTGITEAPSVVVAQYDYNDRMKSI